MHTYHSNREFATSRGEDVELTKEIIWTEPLGISLAKDSPYFLHVDKFVPVSHCTGLMDFHVFDSS